jgi:hypothetical protein
VATVFSETLLQANQALFYLTPHFTEHAHICVT